MGRIKVLEMIDQPFLGGGQMNILSLISSLDESRFEVSVCSRGDGPFVDEVKKNNIKHFPIPFRKKINRKIVQEIVIFLKENRFDILHTHGGVAGLYGRWAAHKSRVPVVIHTLHGIHYLHYRNFFLKYFYVFLERIFSRLTHALVFVSDADREKGTKLRLAAEKKMVVIKNGIDYSVFESKIKKVNIQEELGIDSSHPIVGTVARLHRQKGISYLLKAAMKINQAFPGAKILIIGEGPLKKKLEELIHSLGVDQFVLLLGERKDAQQFLAIFDVFVLPSLWEGLPYVLLEAAALAKPVVATDIDGVREMIRNGKTGMLVPSQNSERLAEAVICLLRDENYASVLGEALKKETTRTYTLSRMIREMQDLYLRLYESVTIDKKKWPFYNHP